MQAVCGVARDALLHHHADRGHDERNQRSQIPERARPFHAVEAVAADERLDRRVQA